VSEKTLSALFFEPEQLAIEVEARGGRPFHVKILREQVLANGVLKYSEMTSLPAGLRDSLAESIPILSCKEIDRTVARDNTTKLLLGFPSNGEGEAWNSVETVHIPPLRKRSEAGATLCVSTQVGCAVACPFCASGRAGLVRNLAAHEILEQYLVGRSLGRIARSVVMGIGEPLHNFQATDAALRLVHEEFGLGARKIILSTVGFPDKVRRAADTKPPYQLAISLHTPYDEQRDELVPAMKGTPIEDVLNAGDYWFEQTGREITYEYVLLGGTNDTPNHAEELAQRLAGRRCGVNLIPFNPVRESGFGRPNTDDAEGFREHLEDQGIVATIRWSRGLESDAACGQLRLHKGVAPA
jgi:23S rRNA (adenine2503-C2)-methyltransferase